MRRNHTEKGQAAVELVALLPAMVLVALLVWQLAVAAHTWMTAQSAARAGARALEVGASPTEAARAVMPRSGNQAIRVAEKTVDGRRSVIVSARTPQVLPGVRVPGRIEAGARVGE
jgi:Flp pilus assembly protein TadG